MKQLMLIVLFAVLLSACQATRLVRVPNTIAADGPPEIRKIVDLGSLNINPSGELSQIETDGSFVSGEWAAVVGKGLCTDRSRVFLDNVPVTIEGCMEGGGLLIRVPRDVRFRHTYKARVETPLGTTDHPLTVANFLIMADPRENQFVFWKSSEEKEKELVFNEKASFVKSLLAGPYALGPIGGTVYVTASSDKPKAGDLSFFELKTVHLGAKGGPKEVSTMDFQAKYEPVSLAIVPGGKYGFLLTSSELIVFDLSESDHPKVVGRQELPQLSKDAAPIYSNIVLLGDGTKGAVLEERSNQVYLLDLSKSATPAILGAFPVGPAQKSSYTIGLVADRKNSNALWVLTGLNAYQVRQRLSNLWSKKASDTTPTRASLVRMELKDNALVAGDPLNLPDGVLPFGLFAEKSGDVLVSSVAFEKEAFAKAELSVKGVSKLLKGMFDSLFAGRIYRVTPQGDVKAEVKSINLPLSMTNIEDSPLIYSTYRITISSLASSVGVQLAVDVSEQQSLEVRDMNWTTLIPPYKFFQEVAVY